MGNSRGTDCAQKYNFRSQISQNQLLHQRQKRRMQKNIQPSFICTQRRSEIWMVQNFESQVIKCICLHEDLSTYLIFISQNHQDLEQSLYFCGDDFHNHYHLRCQTPPPTITAINRYRCKPLLSIATYHTYHLYHYKLLAQTITTSTKHLRHHQGTQMFNFFNQIIVLFYFLKIIILSYLFI